MKLVVKYSKEFPFLPEAVGDNFHDLARILGVTPSSISHAVHRNSEYVKVVNIEPELYPDNDGNLWYKDLNTLETIFMKD